MIPTLAARAPAKVNLTLRVQGRRADGYHDIESLVVFADEADRLTLRVGPGLDLAIRGPNARACGALANNLVLKAAYALAARIPALKTGRFTLTKRLPVAAGLGGGSADAAAALRLLARANRLRRDDPRVIAAAREAGADVPVCLDPRPRVMRGVGEVLSAPLALRRLPAVLVNPGVVLSTAAVFRAHAAGAGAGRAASGLAAVSIPRGRDALNELLSRYPNDLEEAALSLAPAVADVLAALRAFPQCRLARMSGSGATCFALFGSAREADAAARRLRARHPKWWVRGVALGAGETDG